MFHRTRSWAHFALILVVVLLSLSFVSAQDVKPEPVGLRPDAPQYALHGPYWVGTMQLEAQAPSHPTIVTLWYPALNPDGLEENVTYDWKGVTVAGHAIKNAVPDERSGPYPLVIFSHGFNGAPIVSPYLTEHLASQGFVVMAIDHVDNFTRPESLQDFKRMFSRSQDVAWQIDFAETLTAGAGDLQDMIDTNQIAVIGHSLGGQTALLAAGAPIDLRPGSWCGVNPATLLPPEGGGGNMCASGYSGATDALAAVAGLENVPTALWPSWGDSRVDAIVPLAPSLTNFSAESLAGVKVPTMVVFGTTDHWIHSDWPLYKSYAFDEIGSPTKSLVGLTNGDHMVFGDKCDAMPWMIDMGAYFACSDPVWDSDRAHDLINHFATAFLLDVLKGDKDAHAALAPDAVSFPGIEYKAEGF